MRTKGTVLVDPHRAAINLRRHFMGPLHITGPDRAAQTEG